jgi:hypothetical protein
MSSERMGDSKVDPQPVQADQEQFHTVCTSVDSNCVSFANSGESPVSVTM